MIKGLLTRREQAVLIFLAASIVAGSCFLWWERSRASRVTVVHEEQGVVGEPADDSPSTDSDASGSEATSPSLMRPVDVPAQSDAGDGARTEEVTVSVAGAVHKPDVYRLPLGSVVEDAVEAAGGYSEEADPAGINRAAKLIDGTTLTVPAKRSIYVAGDSGPALKIPSPVTNIPAYLPGSVPQGPGERLERGGVQAVASRRININTASREELETLPRIGPKLADAIIEYRGKRPFGSIEEIQNVPGIGPKTFAGFKELITVSGG